MKYIVYLTKRDHRLAFAAGSFPMVVESKEDAEQMLENIREKGGDG